MAVVRLEIVHAAVAVQFLGAAAVQELFEEVPELCVEDGVDDGVEGAVDVAEPRHHAHQGRRDVAVLTASSHRVEDKEGSPAEQEGTCTRGGEEEEEEVKGSFLNSANYNFCFCPGEIL